MRCHAPGAVAAPGAQSGPLVGQGGVGHRPPLVQAADHRVSRAAAIDWTVANWDRIKKKLPDGLSGRLFDLAAFACTAADRERMSAFFGPKTKEVPGTERPLAEARERASSCIALHERGSRAVTEFFNPNAARPLAGPKK